MDYEFQIMTQQQAENIASNWHYDGMYSFYNADADEEDLAELMSPQKRGDKYIVGKKGNEVVGYFSFETKDDSVVIGLGMKPELTGLGMGLEFLRAGINYAISQYKPKEIKLTVATFNERAIKVYQKAGFKPEETFMQDTNGCRFEFLEMTYECSSNTA